MEQRTEEWFQARLGKVSASRVHDILKGKSGYRASRKNYLSEKVCEILSGQPLESFTSAAMQWGTETEPLARVAYEVETGQTVDEVGFILHKAYGHLGASPDGLIGDNGYLEIKCPNTATHIETLLTKKIKPENLTQIQTGLLVTGRKWADFVSYDPRLPEPELQLCIIRVEPDKVAQNNILAESLSFIDEVNTTIEKLRNLKR